MFSLNLLWLTMLNIDTNMQIRDEHRHKDDYRCHLVGRQRKRVLNYECNSAFDNCYGLTCRWFTTTCSRHKKDRGTMVFFIFIVCGVTTFWKGREENPNNCWMASTVSVTNESSYSFSVDAGGDWITLRLKGGYWNFIIGSCYTGFVMKNEELR